MNKPMYDLTILISGPLFQPGQCQGERFAPTSEIGFVNAFGNFSY